MKQPILLKTILDICFIFLAFTFIASLIATILGFYTDEFSINIEIAGNSTINPSFTTISLLILKVVVSGLILFTIYLLRQLVRNFFKGKLFNNYQIDALNLIGQLIILSTLLGTITDFLSNLLITDSARLGLYFEFSFGSFWFVLALGLFFIYLSKIFDNARKMKEENELTV